ncbi:MAG TPA: metallopeptidase family protein [Dehalococcoidia bacterium]
MPPNQRPAARVLRLLRAALDDLPPQYAERLANLEFVVARAPSPRQRRRLKLGGATLYGLYEGVPLTQRGAHGESMPDKITLFWGPLLRDFPDEPALAAEVRKTVYHEIAHYFGLEEDDLSGSSVR